MANPINSLEFRLGVSYFWSHKVGVRLINVVDDLSVITFTNQYLISFFSKQAYKELGLVFSHFVLQRSLLGLSLDIYVFDGLLYSNYLKLKQLIVKKKKFKKFKDLKKFPKIKKFKKVKNKYFKKIRQKNLKKFRLSKNLKIRALLKKVRFLNLKKQPLPYAKKFITKNYFARAGKNIANLKLFGNLALIAQLYATLSKIKNNSSRKHLLIRVNKADSVKNKSMNFLSLRLYYFFFLKILKKVLKNRLLDNLRIFVQAKMTFVKLKHYAFLNSTVKKLYFTVSSPRYGLTLLKSKNIFKKLMIIKNAGFKQISALKKRGIIAKVKKKNQKLLVFILEKLKNKFSLRFTKKHFLNRLFFYFKKYLPLKKKKNFNYSQIKRSLVAFLQKYKRVFSMAALSLRLNNFLNTLLYLRFMIPSFSVFPVLLLKNIKLRSVSLSFINPLKLKTSLSFQRYKLFIVNQFLKNALYHVKKRVLKYVFITLTQSSWQNLLAKSFTKDVVRLYGDVPVTFQIKNLTFFSLTPQVICKYISDSLLRGYSLNRAVSMFLKFVSENSKIFAGIVIVCSGRFSKKQRASYSLYKEGSVEFSNVIAPLLVSNLEVRLKYGICNIQVWLQKK